MARPQAQIPNATRNHEAPPTAVAPLVSPKRGSGHKSNKLMLEELQAQSTFGVHTPFAAAFYNCLAACTLSFNSLLESTKKSYIKAFARFQSIVNLNNTFLGNLDVVLANYGQSMYDENPRPGNRSKLSHLMAYTLIAHPEMRGKLSRTQRLLKAWKKECPPKPATPISRDMMLAFTHYFLTKSNQDAALGMLLCWGGLLRIAEALRLQRKDISLPGDQRSYSVRPNDIGISLLRTKMAKNQYVFISDGLIVRIVSKLLQNVEPARKVISENYTSFSKSLADAAKFFGFGKYDISTHSNRIGGALHLFLNNVSAADIAIQGRWESAASMELYLKSGRHGLAKIKLSSRQANNLQAHVKLAESLFLD